MYSIASRSEQIATLLVGFDSGAKVVPYDVDGRQAAVDFLLEWQDGRSGALEVTLIMDSRSEEWQGLAMRDGWRWPAKSSWEFRPREINFPYKRTRSIVLRAVQLCDEWEVSNPSDLPPDIIADEPHISRFLADGIGSLRRTPFSPGVVIYPSTRADFSSATAGNFALLVESWLAKPHVNAHIQKLAHAGAGRERHLFLVPTDDILPSQFFTDDFDIPTMRPRGYESVDVLRIWSNYWHRYLVYSDCRWAWMPFPDADDPVHPAPS